MATITRLHATSIVFCGRGLLLMGPSGAGKSDLALRVMEAGGSLISDDYTEIIVHNNQLMASPPESIKGMLEVRGIGLLKVPHAHRALINVLVRLESKEAVERLPPVIHTEIEGITLRELRLYPFECSAVAKLRAFLQNQPVYD